MARIKGTVTKAGKSQYSYYVMLDGADFYYNTKFKPKCGEGDVVGIEFTKKAANRGQISKLKVLENNSGGYDASNSERGNSGSGGPRPNYRASSAEGGDRQDSIIWQHSQEMALSAADLLIQAGGFVPKGKDAETKKLDVLTLVDELTVRYFEDASNPKQSKAYKETKGVEADAGDPDDWDSPSNEASDDDWDDSDEWT